MALPEQAPRAPDATNALPMQGGLPPPAPTDGLVISYLGLRKAVGILGIASVDGRRMEAPGRVTRTIQEGYAALLDAEAKW